MRLQIIRHITNVTRLLIFNLVVILLILQRCNAQKGGQNGRQGLPSRTKVTVSSKWIQESLVTHNFFRSLHDAPPLVLNNTLSEISQYYANHLLNLALQSLDSQGSGSVFFDHNPELRGASIGENLYYSIMTAPTEPIPSPYAVLLWYEEIKDYDFTAATRKITSDPKSQIGHLTQLLWKSTLQMGTAYASRKLGNGQTVVFVVANYYPQGNLIIRGNKEKLYLENVLPPSKSDADINAAIVSENIKSWWKESDSEKTTTPESWRNAALLKHNTYRSHHGAQLLRQNADLCKVSQLWANYLLEKGIQAFNGQGVLHQIESNFVGRQLSKLGESSLFFVTADDDLPPEDPIRLWYKERERFDYKASEKSAWNFGSTRTSGFEQIVWNSTTEYCMSYAQKRAENGQYLTYVVANYYPAISFPGRKHNIFKLISKDKNTSVTVENKTKMDKMGLLTNLTEYQRKNISLTDSIPEENYANRNGSCCSLWMIVFSTLGILGTIVLVIILITFLVKKFKPSWYEQFMNITRMQKAVNFYSKK